MKRNEYLREIRREIARVNGIIYLSAPCTEPDCSGDCAACRSEIRYLEDELNRKAERGERIRIAGLFEALSYEEKKEEPVEAEKSSFSEEVSEESTGMPLEEMILSATIRSILGRAGIRTAGELCSITPGQAADLGCLGVEGYREICAAMALLGLEPDPLLERSVLYEKERMEILSSYFD